MVTLTINNSYSKLTGLAPEQDKEFRKALSYTLDAKASYFSGSRRSRTRCLVDKAGNFPTGLLHKIPAGYYEKVLDCRLSPRSLTKDTSLIGGSYPWQRMALSQAVIKGRGIISAPTGTGKSRVIALIAQFFGLKILIVVPTIEIKKQLQDLLKEFQNVTIENIDSNALGRLTDFDCLIIDEAHHVAAKTYHKLNKTAWKGIYYRFFLTATPFRNNKDENMLFEAIAGQVIYKLDYHEAIKKGYICSIEAYYYELPKVPTDAYTWQEVYKEFIVNNGLRNSQIANLLTSLHGSRKHTLCLVKEVKHGKILSEITGLPFVSGVDEDSRIWIKRFNEGALKVLIGTTGILGEGVDTKPCEYVVIAGLGKAKSHFMQQIGRAVRRYEGKESAKVILFKDRSHKFLLRHFKEQCKILKDEYDVIAIKLDSE